MAVLSKAIYNSCYEVGHPWNPSCATASLEIAIVTFIQSLKIYAFVYFLFVITSKRKITTKLIKRILKEWINSSLFLATNGVGYIAFFCIVRAAFRGINVISASFIPAIFASALAIFVERPIRRPLLAIYVTDVASECVWNGAVLRGYVKPVPRGDILLFSSALCALGYFYKTEQKFSSTLVSFLDFLLGKSESGHCTPCRQQKALTTSQASWFHKVIGLFSWRHSTCKHKDGCVLSFTKMVSYAFIRGLLIQLCLRLGAAYSQLIKSPLLLFYYLLDRKNLRLGFAAAWFVGVFKSVCCSARWWQGEDDPIHGAVAGLLAGTSAYFYKSNSLVLYMFWKVIEALYEKGTEAEYLPRVPLGIEILYTLSTAYLFHVAIVERESLRPSYWTFLKDLTWGRMGQYDRTLLVPLGIGT